jgi:hypothetical protein
MPVRRDEFSAACKIADLQGLHALVKSLQPRKPFRAGGREIGKASRI